MSDLLRVGASGVLAYQSALTVVGSNISNASTDGYARRKVTLAESPVSYAGGITAINRGAGGVNATGVDRAADPFKTAQVRSASAEVAASETGVTYLTRIEDALSGSGTSTAMTGFFNAARALAADPTSIAARTTLLSGADTAAAAFRSTAGALSSVEADIRADAGADVDTLNDLAAGVAKLNVAIAASKAGTNQRASLLDQRDSLIDRMSSLVSVSVSTGADGVATVRLNGGTGPILVQGTTAAKLSVSSGGSGTLAFTLGFGSATQVVGVGGGALAGLADASARASDGSATLDEVANGFAQAVNGVQARGIDLDGASGKPMFATAYATAIPIAGTGASASVQVGLAANATPAAGGYTVLWNAQDRQWTLARADGSAQVSGTGTIQLDGVSVTLGGSPQVGDGYTITTGDGAAGLSTTGLGPRGIAAAGAWTSASASGNAGTGTIAAATTGTPSAASYTIRYSAGTVTISDSASGTTLGQGAFSAGGSITAGGVAFTLTGQPTDGDSFTVTPTGAGNRGNANLAALETVRKSGAFEDRLDTMATDTATALSSRKALADAQGAIRDNAAAARDDVSAVNLDEEAVDLLRFQQAYQAASRVVAVARETFQSILDIR